MDYIKLMVVGDGSVGKTSMLISHTTDRFPADYCPTIFDAYAVSVVIKDKTYTFGIFDSAGQADVDCPASFENVRDKWFPEVNHYCPGVPCVLAATKIDLRGDAATIERLAKLRQRPVTTAQGQRLALEVGAAKYVECSALTKEGLKNVFDTILVTSVEHAPPSAKKISCVVV